MEIQKKRGHKPGEMGNNLPFLSLGSDRFVLSVSCGYEHICALLDNKMIKCWGSNTFNPAGLPLPSNYIIETGNKLPFADLGSNLFVNEIYTGYYTSCALIAIVDKIKCWGIVEGFYPIETNGQYAWGDSWGDDPYELGDNLPYLDIENIKKFIITNLASCALFQNQTIKCWGQNKSFDPFDSNILPDNVNIIDI